MKNFSNTYKVAVLALVSALTLSSCGDYLEIEPRNIITEDNFWDEKADVEQMIYGCYVRMMQDDFMRRCIVWGEARSENVINGSAEGSDNTNGKADKSLYDVMRNAIRSENAYTTWLCFYNVINRCNILTVKAPEVAEIDPNFSNTEAAAYVAEVAGLRALCYFYLVRAFNNVPFYFDPVQSEDEVKNLPATPRNEVIDALIEDLKSKVGNAYKALPGFKTPAASTYNSNRMTQYGIYALLCDLCLWRGRYDEVITYADIILQAKLAEYDELEYSSEFSSLLNSVPKLFKHPNDANAPSMISKVTQKKIEGYPLYLYTSGGSELNSYFYNSSAQQGNGFEGLFEINYSNTPDDNGNGVSNSAVGFFYGNWFTRVSGVSNGGHGVMFAEASMSKTAGNGKPDPTKESDTDNKFFLTRYDVRYYSSFERQGGSSGSSSGINYIRKFNAGSAYLSNNNSSNRENVPYVSSFNTWTAREGNWIFYRMTDVMLMKAEALIMQGNYDAAFYLIWAVSRRSEYDAKTKEDATKDGSYSLARDLYTQSFDYMKQLLLGERQREFLFEGKRWFDLLRFALRDNDYVTLRNAVKEKYAAGGSSSDLFRTENSLFFPYNKHELKKVNAEGVVIPQNPHYLNGEEDD